MRKIVITGGPHAGKSTVLAELERLGFICLKEAALEIIEILNKKLGINGQRLWCNKNQTAFQNLITQKQIRNEEQLPSTGQKVAFLDRGLHDGLGYMMFHNITPEDNYLELLRQSVYDKIFILDLITPFDMRKESGRVMQEADALKVSHHIQKAYEQFEYETIRVPQLPVNERVEFILDKMQG